MKRPISNSTNGPVISVGPTGAGPHQNSSGPRAKITGLIMFHLGCQIKFFGILDIFGIKKSKKTEWQPCIP